MPLEAVDPPLKHDLLLVADELLVGREILAIMPFEGALEEPLADALLDDRDGVSQGLDDGLALEGLDRQRVGLGGHDDEGHDGGLGAARLEPVVQAGERLDKHVDALVAVFVAAGGEEVEGVVEIEVVVAVEVAAREIVDLFLGLGVQVLELVHGRELDHVEAVREHAVGLALQEVLALVGGDVRDGCEDVAGVGGGALDAVAVVDAALAGLGIDVEELQVVVEVDGAGAEVSAKECGVGGEDGGDVDPPLAAERQGDAGQPLVKVGDDGLRGLMADELQACQD